MILLVWTLWRKKKKTPTLQFGSVEVLKTVTPSARTRLMHLPLLLKALAIVFAIIALARPQEMNTKIKKSSLFVLTIYCLLDCIFVIWNFAVQSWNSLTHGQSSWNANLIMLIFSHFFIFYYVLQ